MTDLLKNRRLWIRNLLLSKASNIYCQSCEEKGYNLIPPHCFFFQFCPQIVWKCWQFFSTALAKSLHDEPEWSVLLQLGNFLPGKCAGNALLRACPSQHKRVFGSLKTRGQLNMTVVHGFRMVTWIGQQEMSSCVHFWCLPFDCWSLWIVHRSTAWALTTSGKPTWFGSQKRWGSQRTLARNDYIAKVGIIVEPLLEELNP